MAKATRTKNNATVKLSKGLILNRWVLHQFGVNDWESLVGGKAGELKRPVYEGMGDDGQTKYYEYLKQQPWPAGLSAALQRWDCNIVRHTETISLHRAEPIRWKYFQYLALLFTELYLEQFFADKTALLSALNQFVDKWNNPLDQTVPNPTGWICDSFTESELNKIALYNATGSGKTLLMHVNILQYKHYLHLYGRGKEMNKVLLVTPNEGLSQQHLQELADSGIEAELFRKGGGSLYSGQMVEVIEISKLSDVSGEKTVAVDSFETNNLVLIDEGHRGVAGEEWKRRRDQLSATGFAFEYSATFGQAVSAAAGAKKASLMQEYSKSIVMDYSYKYFYHDGYGKEYRILNINDDSNNSFVRKYLTGALLSFYQQLHLFGSNAQLAQVFMLHKPLWVFVGGSVNAVRTEAGRSVSDVVAIAQFFSEFIRDSNSSKAIIESFLKDQSGVNDQNGIPVFRHHFALLNRGRTADEVYLDILKTVFRTNIAGSTLYIDQLKGQDGELGLRVGDNYFGVINVGDAQSLFKLCQAHKIPGEAKEFNESLFQSINQKDSPINVLIGSRKFTEGWSSWRVSAMGLMNIGRGEGAQIIQLFGRGVRLKGAGFSLKRFDALAPEERPWPEGFVSPDGNVRKTQKQILDEARPFVKALETLNIFGVRANYMQQFKEFLAEEGLPSNDGEWEEITLTTMLTTALGNSIRLKVLVPQKDSIEFKREQVVVVEPNVSMGRGKVILEWYPKVAAMQSEKDSQGLPQIFEQKLSTSHLAFINWDDVYLALQDHKAARSWYNLKLQKHLLVKIFDNHDWYTLLLPPDALAGTSYEQVFEWQQIVIALLKGYTDRLYNMIKSGYLSQYMETREIEFYVDNQGKLRSSDPAYEEWLVKEYRVQVERGSTGDPIIQKLQALKTALENSALKPNSEEILINGFTAITFDAHLYQPLLSLDGKGLKDIIKISPVALVESERKFVSDLKTYCHHNSSFFSDKKLFLLRNLSKRGIGFFESTGFYPDFILWLVTETATNICFIDPKGIRHLPGLTHEKVMLHQNIRMNLQPIIQAKDPNIFLHSFIVTTTSFADVKHWANGNSMRLFNEKGIYFQHDQADYISALFSDVINNPA